MAFLDKLTGIAKNIGSKAGGMVETTKLSVKISNEKDNILENQRKIGEYYYKKMQSYEVDAEVKPFFDAISVSLANIATYEKEREDQKAEKSGSIFDTGDEVTSAESAQHAKPAESAEEAPAASEASEVPSAEPAPELAPEQPVEAPAPPAPEAEQPAQETPPSQEG